MPVRKISAKMPAQGAQALIEEVRKRAQNTGRRRGDILVVFGNDGAHAYYEGEDPEPTATGKRRRLRRSSAA